MAWGSYLLQGGHGRCHTQGSCKAQPACPLQLQHDECDWGTSLKHHLLTSWVKAQHGESFMALCLHHGSFGFTHEGGKGGTVSDFAQQKTMVGGEAKDERHQRLLSKLGLQDVRIVRGCACVERENGSRLRALANAILRKASYTCPCQKQL